MITHSQLVTKRKFDLEERTAVFGEQVEVAIERFDATGVEEVVETLDWAEVASVEWLGPVVALSCVHHESVLASAPSNPMTLFRLDSSAFLDPSS